MKRSILFIGIASWAALVDLHGAGDWTVLEDCRLIENPANDGDTFHVSVGAKEYLLRLYLVDAPEIEARDPGRLVEQAKYFEITVPQAIEVGEAAKEFAKSKLAERFKAFTHMSDAMGSSNIERIAAFVQTKEGDLGEQLVRNGLARVHGIKGAPPGSKTSKAEIEKLQQLETEARQEKIGGWGVNDNRLNVRPSKPVAFSIFELGENPTLRANPTAPPAITAAVKPTAAPSIATNSSDREPEHPSDKIEIGKLDINTATDKELEAVPGIGPKIATRIIAARPFHSADDLEKVSGIGHKLYARLRPYFK